VFEVVTWQQLIASGPLPARRGHELVWHAASGKLMTFAGSHGVNDTWLFDPATKQWSPASSADKPSPRMDYAMAADAAGSKVVLFGGGPVPSSSTKLYDTWIWNGATWSRGACRTARPRPRAAHDGAGRQDRVVFYGSWLKSDMGLQWQHLDQATPGVDRPWGSARRHLRLDTRRRRA
jgi:hypothetical protein